ncbi:hypothetical protein [Lentzea sp.]|uniref:hypothetical protein n=1 Tax=Lentzea sp. TaxID=56099 RepID=UPI002CB0B9E5|nr:hypothetical protein [Lentzea sp.]HUQ58640.1 hypothetical protein [Lentzea sp.]
MTYPGGGQGGWNDQQGWGQQQGDSPSGNSPSGNYPSGNYQGGGYPQSGGFPQQGPPPQQGGYTPQGGFPQQGYGGYGGLGVYGGFDDEPPKNKKTLWLVLGAVVLVLLVGGGLTWFLLSDSGDDPNAQGGTTTSSTPAPTSSSQQTDAACPKNDGAQCVKTSLGYTYEVPNTWDIVDASIPVEKFDGVSLTGVTSYGDYTCEGKPFTKGTNGGALLPKADLNQTAADFTKAISAQFYSSGGAPKVELTQPKPVKIQHTQKDNKKVVVEGVQVDATVTQSGNKCLASKGMLKVVVLNGSSKLHVLVVNGDLEGGGGGTTPPLLKEADLQKIVDSLVPTT